MGAPSFSFGQSPRHNARAADAKRLATRILARLEQPVTVADRLRGIEVAAGEWSQGRGEREQMRAWLVSELGGHR